MGRRTALWAAAILLPATVAVSALTAWSAAVQIEELLRRNLALELGRLEKTASDEVHTLEALELSDVEFYRANAQRKVLEWARSHPPRDGFLFITAGQDGLVRPARPLEGTVFLEQDFLAWGWTLGAAVSRAALDALGWQTLWNTVGINIAACLPLAFGVWLMTRTISRPIDRLRLAAERLAEGDFSIRARPVGSPEIQTLAQSFNTMAEHLQDLHVSLEDRVRERTEELEQSRGEIVRQERLASLGSLVAGVAHEINTPLGICVTSTSTLSNEAARLDRLYRDGTMTQESFESFLGTLREGFRLLEGNLARAHELVASFKRLSVNQTADQTREFDPLDLLNDVVASLSHELKVARVEVSVTGDRVALRGAAGLLSQVALNWLKNSLVHAFDGRGGHATFASTERFDGWELRYADDGRGMDAETLKHLYEPFFTTKPGSGSGLGMSVVYNVVSRLGGTIEVASSPGEGTRYRVFLPSRKDGYEILR